MTRIHIYRTETKAFCGLDPRLPAAPEAPSRTVSPAHYRVAAERFANGRVPGDCADCVEGMLLAGEEVRKEAAKIRRKRRATQA